jgi:5'-nucleotidase
MVGPDSATGGRPAAATLNAHGRAVPSIPGGLRAPTWPLAAKLVRCAPMNARPSARPSTTGPPLGRGLYCNRTLNLRSIRAIGYDMDYTLVHYRVEPWEQRAYAHLQRKLGELGWPVEDLVFDPELVMRGLVIDTELGNIVKANRFGYVKRVYHGTRPMDYESQRRCYAREFVELRDPRWSLLNTLFSLSEGCMLAQLVDRLDAGKLPKGLGYRDLYRTVRSSIDEAHMEGQLKAEILARPDEFVELDPEAALALLDQKHAGKKLLLVTNSEWSYTTALMSYAFDRFLPAKMAWRDLFELVLVGARKPSFFDSGAPALEVVSEDGMLRPHVGRLRSGGCYFGGNAALVEQHLALGGEEILYVGDHVYSDVELSKSLLRWRTALVLRELEQEVAAAVELGPADAELTSLMRDKEQGEAEHYQLRLQLQRRRSSYGPQGGESTSSIHARMRQLRQGLLELDLRLAPLVERTSRAHNARWGLLLRAGNDKSKLARQLERYADVYTSRVSNFLYATPFAYLRSQRGSLPHDPTAAG